jgi:hypothetical protein
VHKLKELREVGPGPWLGVYPVVFWFMEQLELVAYVWRSAVFEADVRLVGLWGCGYTVVAVAKVSVVSEFPACLCWRYGAVLIYDADVFATQMATTSPVFGVWDFFAVKDHGLSLRIPV